MKFKTLRLLAYGPFTDVTLDLSGDEANVHMIFGPNEAGKSTALRALRNMLFGMPAQMPDNFLHGYSSLRIGATIVNSSGERLEFLRRKGNVKTLRGLDDETVLDDDALAPFLGGIDRDVFEQMFAIGHDDLVRGGQEILSGKGNIGQALFAAGAGLIPLQAVQQGLEQDCGELFKPAGSKPRINSTISAVKAIQKEQKDALLPAKIWQEHEQALRHAQVRMEIVRESLARCRQIAGKLRRIRDALPLIAKKREVDTKLADYRDVPDLSDDFGEKRRDVEKDLKIATVQVQRSEKAVEKIRLQMAELTMPEGLIENASAIESLQHDLGSFRKAQKDRPGLEGRMRTHRKQASAKLAEVGADTPPSLPPSTVGEIQDLGSRYERLIAKLETARENFRKLEKSRHRLAETRKTIPVPADVSALESAIQTVQESGPVEKRLAELNTAVDTLQGELDRFLKRQTLWQGPLDEMDALPCPSTETIDRFEDHFTAAGRQVEKLHDAKTVTEQEIDQIRTDLQAIDRASQIPTESNLKEARAVRSQGWGLIRRTLEGEPPNSAEVEDFAGRFQDSANLPDAFEVSVNHADQIADRLRREADQVSQKGILEARCNQLKESLDKINEDLQSARDRHGELEAEWRACWAPCEITPLSPKEMRAWLAEIMSARERMKGLRAERAKRDATAAELANLRSNLLAALEKAGAPSDKDASLSGLMRQARANAVAQRELESDIESADRDLSKLEKNLNDAAEDIAEMESQLSDWQGDWAKQVRKIGLDDAASPAAARNVIESIREAKTQSDEAEVLRKRIEGIDRDAAQFEARVDSLVNRLAADLKMEPCDRAAEMLKDRLTAARTAQAELTGLKEQLSAAEEEKKEAEQRILEGNAQLETLCREAQCAGTEALAETEQRAKTRKGLIQELSGLEERLRELSAGATVEDFIAEAASLDADGIDPKLRELEIELDQFEQERSALDQTIGKEEERLARMDGSALTAEHAETAERLLAGLEADVETYARLKIASLLLSRTVEQYREKHQGPLIERAGTLFAQMTMGAFDRLRADYDTRGNPVLVGIRPGSGSPISVDGMSDGTADQLYLALRLASLEQYLDSSEPLPFVVDDILLRFDDDRALATLKVLADLSTKTQVLFFTHHQHLVDLVKTGTGNSLSVCFHTLGSHKQ